MEGSLYLLPLEMLHIPSMAHVENLSQSGAEIKGAAGIVLAGCGDYGDDVSGVCRVRQKPKMEIVLTKSAEFDAIVAEENDPNGADSGDYNGVTF